MIPTKNFPKGRNKPFYEQVDFFKKIGRALKKGLSGMNC